MLFWQILAPVIRAPRMKRSQFVILPHFHLRARYARALRLKTLAWNYFTCMALWRRRIETENCRKKKEREREREKETGMKDFRSRGEETSVPKLGYRASTRGELRNYLSYRENLTLMATSALHETPCDRLLLFRASFMHYWSQKMERSLCKQNVPHFLPFFRIFLISRSFSAWRGSTPLISFILFFKGV